MGLGTCVIEEVCFKGLCMRVIENKEGGREKKIEREKERYVGQILDSTMEFFVKK